MKFVLYTVCISPHQLPLMRRLVESLSSDECRYIYTEELENGRKDLGWTEEQESWLICEKDSRDECRKMLEECDVLLSGIRDFDLFEKRKNCGKKTIYCSERWFKPILINRAAFPGTLKLLHPGFLKTALRFRRMLRDETENNFLYYPISMNAARDAAFLCHGSRNIEMERVPGGKCLDKNLSGWRKKLHLWGYFVEESKIPYENQRSSRSEEREEIISGKRPLRLLWVGRMLALKNVDCIIEAFRLALQKSGREITLTLVGDGPEKRGLMRIAEGVPVEFRPFVPIHEIRTVMQEHDMYIFASNSFDGWGAVVNEAIEEGMTVVASRESGSGTTILPESCTFGCRNIQELAELILSYSELPIINAEQWSARSAANYLLEGFLK